ncbi:hypothetical protein [Thiomicrorhabdus hydrogeniphila]
MFCLHNIAPEYLPGLVYSMSITPCKGKPFLPEPIPNKLVIQFHS